MKILCVIDSLCVGGAQNQLIELAKAFKGRAQQVSFLTYHGLSFFNPVLEDEEIPLSCIEEPNYLKRLFKMRRFIRKGKFDAVLSFLEGAGFICEFAGLPHRKWKLVIGERSANPDIRKSARRRIYRWCHVFADYVVANSKANMELVRTVNPLLPASKCRIIFNLVNFSRFQPSPAFRFRKDGKLSLLVAARIKQEKNMGGLIKALSLLSEEERNKIRVDWYGEYMQQSDPFNSLDESMRQIKAYGLEQVIRFHEAIHDVDRMIREADAVGLFSLFEGFPNVICEAMACQKPVICTRVSDISGFLAHEPGLLCNPFDPYSIKNALSCLIGLDNTQLEQIGTINRSIALERFNPDMIVTEYLQLMNNTIRAN